MSVKLLKEIGYKPKMEYWDDFEMAFNVGLLRVQDVFNNFFKDRKEDFTAFLRRYFHQISRRGSPCL